MKRCPTCNKTFTDQNLSFCLDDGTPLVPVDVSADETTIVGDETTRVSPSPNLSDSSGAYKPRDWQADYQPPGSYATGAPPSKRKVWPWIVGILALLVIGVVGLGIAAAVLIPNLMRSAANRNSSRANANVERQMGDRSLNNNNPAPNTNSDELTENTNTNADPDGANQEDENTTLPPTDAEKVLADLTELEQEWTVANINADRQKLDRILADDYVGTSSDGKSQGKADYLQTIKRDTSIQKWDFEDLKVELKGNRAALLGVIRLQLTDREVGYSFTDKFVWRDGRWQAVGSEVTPVEQ